MKQRNCPICDQTMKSAHYCSYCKKFIKNPIEREANYYLNERHREFETNCSFHQPEAKTEHSMLTQEPPSSTMPPPKNKQETSGKQGNTGLWVCLGLFVAGILTVGAGLLGNMVQSVMWPISEYDKDLGDFFSEEETYNYETFSDEQVIAVGEACSSSYHFAVTGAQVEAELVEQLKSKGYQVMETEFYSYNEKYEYGDTWYSSSNETVLSKSGGAPFTLIVSYDTAVGKLHSIELETTAVDQMIEIAEELLEYLEEKQVLSSDQFSMEGMKADMKRELRVLKTYEWANDMLYMSLYDEDEYGIWAHFSAMQDQP